MNQALNKLLNHPAIWQSARKGRALNASPTGFAALDNSLHAGGWVKGGLNELLCTQQGIGELQLLLPTLARISQAGQFCLLLSPPHTPYPPALQEAGVAAGRLLVVDTPDTAEQLWCAEQALLSGATACVIAWFDNTQLQSAQLRKLLLAARQSSSLLFLYRSEAMAKNASPANLRLVINNNAHRQLNLEVLKQPGGWAGQHITIERQESWLKPPLWQLPLLPANLVKSEVPTARPLHQPAAIHTFKAPTNRSAAV